MIDKEIFDRLRKVIYEQSGIFLREQKEVLVSARIGKRLRALNLPDYKSYLNYLEDDKTGHEIVNLLDVISTNVTSFFRGQDHFSFLKAVLQKWIKQGQQRFRLWSAACSSGEEPYSIAMTAHDFMAGFNVDIKILATDISTRILKLGQTGIYPVERINEIPVSYQRRFLLLEEDSGSQPEFSIKDSIKNMVVFNRLNLSAPPFPMKGPFDVIFCRNVMIYFDDMVRDRLLKEISRLLRPGGVLFVGHAEGLSGQNFSLKVVRPSVYVKSDESKARYF